MRKIVVSEYVSLDGVFEEPGEWSFDFFNDEAEQFKFDELFASDLLLLGRKTYEGFAAAWPSMSDERGFADRMNSLPKLVASTTLDEAEWNASLVRENVAEEVSKLKQQPGRDILVGGSAELAHPDAATWSMSTGSCSIPWSSGRAGASSRTAPRRRS